MTKGFKLTSVAAAAAVATSLSVGGGIAQATTTWRSTKALSGLSPSRFGSDCQWTYNGTAIFETTFWVCWRPYDQIVCSVDSLRRSINCRTNMPYAVSPANSTSLAGPTEVAAR